MNNKGIKKLIIGGLLCCGIWINPAFSQNWGDFSLSLYQDERGGQILTKKNSPEFAFLLPEMTGNMKFGGIVGNQSRWLKDIPDTEWSESKGVWTYTINQPLSATSQVVSKLTIRAVALPPANGRGLILEVTGENIPENVDFFWSYGGALGRELQEAPDLVPSFCKYNVFSVERNVFTLYYGRETGFGTIQGIAPVESEIRLSDAYQQSSPLAFFNSGKKTDAHALSAKFPLKSGEKYYFCIYKRGRNTDYTHYMLPKVFEEIVKELRTKS